ncbi:MAG: hypothetical protein GX118_00240 [Arcobacter butzleri]|nr:hypothetical protein [Aliarcobacter butzleri]
MHTIKLSIQDKVFDKVMYFLSNLPKDEVVIEEYKIKKCLSYTSKEDIQETKSFSDHSANLIKEWKDSGMDDIWK